MDRADPISDVHNHCIDVQGREIYLHGHIGDIEEDPGVEYREASLLIKNLRILDRVSKEPILIHMFSIGGEWNSGMAIYDTIRACESPVNILVYGQAESMGSLILQAASTRVMMPTSYFMAHYGETSLTGGILEVQSQAKLERDLMHVMLDVYAARFIKSKFWKEKHTGGTHEKAKNHLARKLKNGDWYLNPEETIYYGFADQVFGGRKFKKVDSIK